MANKEQLRKLRQKYHLGEYSTKAHRRKRASRGDHVAKKHYRRSRGLGLRGLTDGLVYGAATQLGLQVLAPNISKNLLMSSAAAGTVGYVLGGKQAALGAVAGNVGTGMLVNVSGGSAGTSWYGL